MAGCYKGQKKYPPAEHSIYEVPYATGLPGEEFLKLDVHFPDGAAGLPVIIYIHGGGWIGGDKRQMDVWSKRMANRGYVVFNVNYRLAPENPFPAAVNDCLGALLWVKEHAADYGGDNTRIGVTGGSAGGHLTLVVATEADDPAWRPTGHEDSILSRKVQAQAPFFGIADFTRPGVVGLLGLDRKFLGGKLEQEPENFRLASPVNYASKDAPPTLIVCGKLDPLYGQSLLYYRALLDAGAEVEFVTYDFQTHGFDSYMWTRASRDSFEKMMEFFDSHLR